VPIRGDFPEEGELVVATVTQIRDFGAFTTLDEYNNREAFIHLSEVATGWVKYIRDHIRERQKIVGRVLHVDTAKGQIDLSLKRINEHQRREKIQSWKNEQRAQRLLAIVAKALKLEVEATYAAFADKLVEELGSLYHAFEAASAEPKKFSEQFGKAAWVSAVMKVAQENLTPPRVTISGTLEVSSSAPEGVLDVRTALRAAEEVDPESVTVQYVGAPRYRVQVTGTQYKQVEEVLKRATEATLAKIAKAGGHGSFVRA
jgi:translation initiation factor 2 subunit 1